MNRLLLVVNALLALVLLVRVCQSPASAATVATPAVALAADALRVDTEFLADGRASAVIVQFGADFRPAQDRGEPVDLGVRLDPPQPVLTTWRTPHSLAITPDSSGRDIHSQQGLAGNGDAAQYRIHRARCVLAVGRCASPGI